MDAVGGPARVIDVGTRLVVGGLVLPGVLDSLAVPGLQWFSACAAQAWSSPR